MRNDRTTRAATMTALLDLLADEARAIRRGDLAGLADMSARKSDLTDRLLADPAPTAAALNALRQAAAANHQLLAAAQRGVQAARRRFDTLTRAGATLTTYDQLGRRRDHGDGAGQPGQRA